VSDVPLAGGAQAGGWFPSITFVEDWDGDGRGPDALIGSNHRCWLYRGLAARDPSKTSAEAPVHAEHNAPRFEDAVPLQAGGKDIHLVNPRFDCADIDGDGDLDLFAGTQPGPIHWFKNCGTLGRPELAAGKVVAFEGKYLIGDAHSGVKVADMDGDGLLDLMAGRFWERIDLNQAEQPRDFGGFYKNIGTRTSPRFERRSRGAPFTEQFQICDAIRQNAVRAVDWNDDGRLDLLAGDTDGSIWFFEMLRSQSTFAAGKKFRAAGKLLSVAASGGHARLDICDWNDDMQKDLVVADGAGTGTLFLNRGGKSKPELAAGRRMNAAGKAIQVGARASVLVCDWDSDTRKDLLLADDKGYYFCKNLGTIAQPMLASPRPILFGGKPVKYVRPNLGSFVDWDGDGRKDFIGCHFENSVRFYRNLGSGAKGAEPQFADSEGVVIVQGESPQKISGAEAVDWNGDGDLDILTGQGHGGSGLRFYERDWIEDRINNTHPRVTVLQVERRR
jgi:hypothetical protein